MKVLIHDDRPDLYQDLMADHLAGDTTAICQTYDGLAAAAAAAQPEVVYSCKFAGVPYPHAAITGLD
ncbi:MAG: hypothetical protein RII27_04400, partial [Alphaproteobacteria bacterium]